jgi:hypothetical protein
VNVMVMDGFLGCKSRFAYMFGLVGRMARPAFSLDRDVYIAAAIQCNH